MNFQSIIKVPGCLRERQLHLNRNVACKVYLACQRGLGTAAVSDDDWIKLSSATVQPTLLLFGLFTGRLRTWHTAHENTSPENVKGR